MVPQVQFQAIQKVLQLPNFFTFILAWMNIQTISIRNAVTFGTMDLGLGSVMISAQNKNSIVLN